MKKEDKRINGGLELELREICVTPEILTRHHTRLHQDPNIGLQDQKIDNYLSMLVFKF